MEPISEFVRLYEVTSCTILQLSIDYDKHKLKGGFMKIRNIFLLLIILALPMLLAACGGDKVGNAEKFMKALADNDLDEAKKYICDDEKDTVDEDAASFEGVNLTDISCEEDGDNVKCDFKIGIEGVEGETPSSITFEMDGDKVCGTVE